MISKKKLQAALAASDVTILMDNTNPSPSPKPTPQKRHKHNAVPTVVDDIHFKSKGEGLKRYPFLKQALIAGLITDLEPGPMFELQPAFRRNGQHFPDICYSADFAYTVVATGETWIEDWKSWDRKAKKIHVLSWVSIKRFMFLFPHENFILNTVKDYLPGPAVTYRGKARKQMDGRVLVYPRAGIE